MPHTTESEEAVICVYCSSAHKDDLPPDDCLFRCPVCLARQFVKVIREPTYLASPAMRCMRCKVWCDPQENGACHLHLNDKVKVWRNAA